MADELMTIGSERRPPEQSPGVGPRLGLVTLSVTLYEDEEPEWAEWELWRNTSVGSDNEQAAWIGHGTAPSFLGALDAAAKVWDEHTQDRRHPTQHSKCSRRHMGIIGHHVVRVFSFEGKETTLPEGWKPFAVEVAGGESKIVARKWVREITTEAEAAVTWAEAVTKERWAGHMPERR